MDMNCGRSRKNKREDWKQQKLFVHRCHIKAELQIIKITAVKMNGRTWNNVGPRMKICQGKWPECMGKFLKKKKTISINISRTTDEASDVR
jgi:hypothetical protein